MLPMIYNILIIRIERREIYKLMSTFRMSFLWF